MGGLRWGLRRGLRSGLVTLFLAGPATQAEPLLRFVALGDQPYGRDVSTGPAYRHLIGLINAEQPPFSIHVGDLKDGLTECSDELYAQQYAHFNRFDTALIYTPGDNDWTDCQRQHADPLERLHALRQRFFAGPQSLGARPIRLERQPELMPAFGAYRENQRWWHQGVLFVTLHTVGPNDNAMDESSALMNEHRSREAANVAWVRSAFDEAKQKSARAIVFATQADVFRSDKLWLTPAVVRQGFRGLVNATLLPMTAACGLPVLFVHGDGHRYKTDQPFVDANGRRIENLWRLEVPGESQMHAVLVTIDPSAAQPFGFKLIWNRMSPDPR